MAEKYPCPKCGAVLRPSKPIPAGKKLRCPKCENVFAPTAAATAGAAAKPSDTFAVAEPPPKPPPKPVADDDEDSELGYGVTAETEAAKEKAKAAKKIVELGDLRDRFEKKKRGPAMALVVKPTNIMLWEGALLAVWAVIFIVWQIWDLVFVPDDVTLKREFVITQLLFAGLGILKFVWGCLICIGASKMQYLESYAWSMAGAILAVPVGGGIWGIITLRDPDVIAGFEEGVPDYDPLVKSKNPRNE